MTHRQGIIDREASVIYYPLTFIIDGEYWLIERLPQWACVALAAHCARSIAEIIFSKSYFKQYHKMIFDAIEIAERAASNVKSPESKNADELVDMLNNALVY